MNNNHPAKFKNGDRVVVTGPLGGLGVINGPSLHLLSCDIVYSVRLDNGRLLTTVNEVFIRLEN